MEKTKNHRRFFYDTNFIINIKNPEHQLIIIIPNAIHSKHLSRNVSH